jgi:hypothetical protein
MGRIIRKKCKHCNKLFIPDTRNAKRQNYCARPACRKASKIASQRRRLQKDENKDYFSGPDHCQRVRRWWQAHPGYWRRIKKNADTTDALQDPLIAKPIEIKAKSDKLANEPLQDFLISQPDVIIGLIANFTGLALQDDIAFCLHRLQQLGRDILTPNKGADDGSAGSISAWCKRTASVLAPWPVRHCTCFWSRWQTPRA